jgi:hypothetical protein
VSWVRSYPSFSFIFYIQIVLCAVSPFEFAADETVETEEGLLPKWLVLIAALGCIGVVSALVGVGLVCPLVNGFGGGDSIIRESFEKRCRGHLMAALTET